MQTDYRLPFEGLTVLSLAEQYPGPYATLILADLGADVILVERPDGGDPARQFPAFFESLNRNKRSIALDLKRPGDRFAFLALAEKADVVLEGFRPGTAERLGIGYGDLSARNRRLIYVSISGFGQHGPYRMRAAHDLSYQALAGLLYDRVGRPDSGAAPAVLVGDLCAGMFGAMAVMTGLIRRLRTDEGAYIDVSMADGLVSWMTTHLFPLLNGLGEPGLPSEPGYGLFRTADGLLVSLSISHEDRFWVRLCELTDLQDVAHLDGAERHALADPLRDRLAAAIATKTRDVWQAIFDAADVPSAPVLSLHEVLEGPHLRARGLISDLPAQGRRSARRHLRQPMRIAGIDDRPRLHAPELGEHTEEILAAAGITPSAP